MHETRNDTALSRRGFFKAAALGGAGLAGAAIGGAQPRLPVGRRRNQRRRPRRTGEPSFLTAPRPSTPARHRDH
ncbi:MAG: twin-arginine translocation signal domain-containing protein [Adlercreutzia equolifaciens]